VQALYNYINEDGSMKGGDPGIRLIEPSVIRKNLHFEQVTENKEVSIDELLVIPVYRIFGSDELSSVGPAVEQKLEKPFVLMNLKDAEIISVKEGDTVELEIMNIRLTLKVKFENTLRKGIAGLSVNFPGMPFIDFPASGKFHKL